MRRFVALLALCASLCLAQSEQTKFAPEGRRILAPVMLPQSVLDVLAKDSLIRKMMLSEQVQGDVPASWVKASVIHLRADGERAYVVAGEGPLMEDHAQYYWVVRMAPAGPQIIFHGFGDALTVRRKKHRGFRDIEMGYFAGDQWHSTVYVFKKDRYEAIPEKSAPAN